MLKFYVLLMIGIKCEGKRLQFIQITGYKTLWLREYEMKLKVYGLLYRYTEVSNECKICNLHSLDTVHTFNS